MTGLLEKALKRVEALSQEEQDAIAAQILESLDDDAAWDQALAKDPEKLQRMARAARDEHRRGETEPLDKLLSE